MLDRLREMMGFVDGDHVSEFTSTTDAPAPSPHILTPTERNRRRRMRRELMARKVRPPVSHRKPHAAARKRGWRKLAGKFRGGW